MVALKTIESILKLSAQERAEVASVIIESLGQEGGGGTSSLVEEALLREKLVEEGKARFLEEGEFLAGIQR